MSRNGSGTYTLPAGNPVVSGTTITTTWANTTLTDIANSLTGSVAADGQTPMTGALNMGNNKVSSLATPTATTDAVTKAYADALIGAGSAGVFSSVTDSGLTSGRVTYASTGGLLADSSNFTYDGTTVASTKFSGAFNGTLGATTPSTAVVTSLTDSGLTAGRVNYNGTGGLLVDSANMTFNGTGLTLANDASISGLTVGKGGGAVSSNIAVGASALANSTGSSYGLNAFGYQSLIANTSGNSNNSFGSQALASNTTGSSNVAVGHEALKLNTTASNNTALGYQAGSALTTGSGNVLIGKGTATSGTGDSYSIVIGGNSPIGKGDNTGFISPNGGACYQGNNSATWSITSDARLKKNIVDNTTGLGAISQIQVRNFEYRTADEVTDFPKQTAIEISGVQLGAIAQELQAILPDCVKTESTGVMSVDTTNLTWYLINAVKELNAKITALENK